MRFLVFRKTDKERNRGLNERYFKGMSKYERRKAYQFLKREFDNGSGEAVTGLKALLGKKCISIFQNRIDLLRGQSSLSEQRLSLALYLLEYTGDIQYQSDMAQYLAIGNDRLKQTILRNLQLVRL